MRMNYIEMATRNIARNRRRSLVTISAVAFGFAAICLFAGYIKNVFSNLKDQAIHGELLGHLTVAKKGLRTAGKLHPEKYLFSGDELRRVSELLRAYPHTKLVSPRFGISGMITNGSASTIFIGEGVVPADLVKLRGDFQRKVSGDLEQTTPTGVALADQLASILGFGTGSSAAVLVSTISGQANALDVDVIDTFNTGNAGTNDKFVFMPFSLAQSLLDVDGAERIVVLLDDERHTDAARTELLGTLSKAGFDVEIDTWLTLSSFYRQVSDMFTMIFSFIFSIVLIVVITSIVNAMSMAVVERTREIGMLRAVGLRPGSIINMFTVEAAVLVTIGSAIGLLFGIAVQHLVNLANFTYTPPNSSSVVPLLVDFDTPKAVLSFLSMSLLAALSAYLPARRASRRPLIECLSHI